MAAGRIALHVPTIRLLLLSLGVTLAGFALFWVATAPWLAVTGLFVVGLGIAVQYPLVISLALAAAPGQADRASGLTSYPVAFGFGVAPVVLGALADRSGTHEAFLVLPVFIVAAVALTLWLARSLALPKIGEPHTESRRAGGVAAAATAPRRSPWSPSIRSTKGPPSPSMVNAPATCKGSPVPT